MLRPMKLFDGREKNLKAVREAMDYAEEGGQALHVWPQPKNGWPNAPKVFRDSKLWAHLIDRDRDRLVKTAKELGVNVIRVEREGERGQHIDLCAGPLKKALRRCGVSSDDPILVE